MFKEECYMDFFDWNVHHKITLLVVVSFIIGLFLLWFFYPQSICVKEKQGIFYFLKALRTNNVNLCDKIFFQSKKESCLGALHKDEKFCSETPIGTKDDLCVGLARNDVNYCGASFFCRAMLSKDENLCDKLPENLPELEQGDNEEEIKDSIRDCKAFVNFDAEFFISSEELAKC